MRQFLYRVLPSSWIPYILHTRPRAWPIVAAHMTIGYLLAKGIHLSGQDLLQWGAAVLAWAVLGNGGTLALNSAFDKDEGDIGYLDNPPPVPRHLALFSIVLMILAVPLAWMVGTSFTIACLICCIMSLLYSVPPFRFKARAGLDVLINSIGFGALTIFAGWAAAGRSIEGPIINVMLAFFFFFAGFYPLTQIYQIQEDKSRGDYTLTIALGKVRALLMAVFCIGMGFAFLTTEIITNFLHLRSLGIGLAFVAWAAVLLPWYARWDTASMAYEKRGFYLALYAWALTDIAVAVAMMPI